MASLILGGTASNWVDELAHWAAVVGHYLQVAAQGQAIRSRP